MSNRFDDMRVKGINTNDATATAGDIMEGKTAYVAGHKITGINQGGGGSASYNLYRQLSEPTEKDGIWIRTEDGSNNIYFSQNVTGKGRFIDGGIYSYLNSNTWATTQIVIGDYLYCFGSTSANSYKYNLRTRQYVGTINIPDTFCSAYAFYYGGNIHIVTHKSTSGDYSGYNSFYVIYYPVSNTYRVVRSLFTGNPTDPYYFFVGRSGKYLYIYERYYYTTYSTRLDMETEEVVGIPALSVSVSIGSTSNTLSNIISVGDYMYILDSNKNFYKQRLGVAEGSNLNSPPNNSVIYGAGNFIYGFKIGTNSTEYYRYNITLNTWDTFETQIPYSIEGNMSSTSYFTSTERLSTNRAVYDEATGLLYLRSNGKQTSAFQFNKSPILEGLSNGTIVIVQDFSTHPTLLQDSTNLFVGVNDVGIVKSDNDGKYIDGDHLVYWGDGEVWNVLKNPIGATATIVFNTNGGSLIQGQSVVIGQTATKPSDPTKSGYLFDYWSLGGVEYDFSTPVTSDITLVAEWEAVT